MAWARLDDRLPWNHKVQAISDRAFRLYITSIAFCSGRKNAGFMSKSDLKIAVLLSKMTPKNGHIAIKELVASRLFVDESATENGAFSIHDFKEYNGNSGSTGRVQKHRENKKKALHETLQETPLHETFPSRARGPVPSQLCNSQLQTSNQDDLKKDGGGEDAGEKKSETQAERSFRLGLTVPDSMVVPVE